MDKKSCSVCGAEKALDAFYKHVRCTGGREGACKQCRINTVMTWRRSNPEKASGYRDKWNAAHPKKLASATRKWASKNVERVRAVTSAWSRKHPAQNNARTSRHRAEKLRAIPGWADPITIREIYAFAALKTKLTGKQWHVDHIVPLRSKVVCGLYTDYNLQVIPGPENSAKGNRHWPDMPTGE